ncbi:hypothetical protein EGI15_10095 [Chryseobacterium cucumeris]|uniref:Uncharacterized protein n=1 Tax=Chryseobacterium cucumeris TaxID=1813611 RepID=A0ABX9X6N6_9FLAO|nr:hypothetical protein A1704_07945 [Chryseobacterium cucumeris]ROH92571.1 hypothetical protein EGI15_10095 [Chryseobacterium cucumeris]
MIIIVKNYKREEKVFLAEIQNLKMIKFRVGKELLTFLSFCFGLQYCVFLVFYPFVITFFALLTSY